MPSRVVLTVPLDMNPAGPEHDLDALGDTAPRAARVARAIEYTRIVTELVETGGPANA